VAEPARPLAQHARGCGRFLAARDIGASAETHLRDNGPVSERSTPAPRTAEWFAADARRNDAAIRERLRADGAKPLGQNLEEGVRLIAIGFELVGAAAPSVRE